MWVWFASIGVSWVKLWISMVGRGLWFMGFGFGLIFPLSDCCLLRWVCSDVGVVCSDQCIMGQVVDRHGGPWVMVYGFWIWVDLSSL